MIVSMFTWVWDPRWDHGYRYDYNAMGVGTGTSLACQEVTGKETDIIHLAMGVVKKVFTLVGGVQKVLAACERGSKKFDDKNFQLPSSPHQSEHSLKVLIERV